MNNKESYKKSDLRIFGLIWALIFSIISYKFSEFATLVAIISICFLFFALFYPEFFVKTKFYSNWIKLGDILGKINGFIITFILFYLVFTPIALVLKLLKKDLLAKKIDKNCKSYFIDRTLQPDDMRNQF